MPNVSEVPCKFAHFVEGGSVGRVIDESPDEAEAVDMS